MKVYIELSREGLNNQMKFPECKNESYLFHNSFNYCMCKIYEVKREDAVYFDYGSFLQKPLIINPPEYYESIGYFPLSDFLRKNSFYTFLYCLLFAKLKVICYLSNKMDYLFEVKLISIKNGISKEDMYISEHLFRYYYGKNLIDEKGFYI